MLYRFNDKYLKFLFVISLGLVMSGGLLGQDIAEDISPKQVQNAQSQARFLIESFGEFLQIIAESQDGGEVRKMIEMTTEDGQLSKRLFTNKKVLIVSDIDPRVVDEESTVGEGFTEISSYLADFDAFYDKKIPNGISIEDIYVSKIKKSRLTGDLYLRVKYTSKFEGRHKDIRKAYERIDRMARVRVKQGEQWSYYIDLITFRPQKDTTSYYEVETREQIQFRYRAELKRAQRLWEIFEYEQALETYKLSNQIFTIDSIVKKIDLIEEIIDDRKDRKYYGLEGFSRKIADEPTNPNLYYERGLKYLEAKKAKAANDDFQQALSMSKGKYKAAWIGLADIWEKERGINAIEYLEEAIKLDPDERATLERLIRIQIAAKLWPDAKRNLERIPNISLNEGMLMSQGIVNQNLDQYKDAAESFHQLTALNPQSAEAYFELGRCYLNLSEFDRSMENFREAIDLNFNEFSAVKIAKIYVNKARNYQQEQKLRLAELAVDQALKLLPEMPEAKSLKNSLSGVEGTAVNTVSAERKEGDLYFMEGNYKEALRFYRTLSRKRPRERELVLKIGKCYFELGEYNKAILSAQEVLAADVQDEEALLLKAESVYKKGDPANALVNLEELIKINPASKEALLLKTSVYLSLEDYIAAFLNLERWEALQAQEGDLDNLAYRKLKAKALIGLEKIEEGLIETDFILQRENFNAEFLYLKAYCLYQQKQYDECISFSDAALKSDKKLNEALILKVKAYLKKGAPQLALSSIDAIQGVNKELYTVSYYKSMANFALGDHKTAKVWIDRALKARKNDLDAQLLNGKILLALERYLDAGMALNTAYKLNPDHPEANFQLGRYYHEFGVRQTEDKRFEDALPYYYKALELAPELFEGFPELVKRLRG